MLATLAQLKELSSELRGLRTKNLVLRQNNCFLSEKLEKLNNKVRTLESTLTEYSETVFHDAGSVTDVRNKVIQKRSLLQQETELNKILEDEFTRYRVIEGLKSKSSDRYEIYLGIGSHASTKPGLNPSKLSNALKTELETLIQNGAPSHLIANKRSQIAAAQNLGM